jgi:hypothetical protein
MIMIDVFPKMSNVYYVIVRIASSFLFHGRHEWPEV